MEFSSLCVTIYYRLQFYFVFHSQFNIYHYSRLHRNLFLRRITRFADHTAFTILQTANYIFRVANHVIHNWLSHIFVHVFASIEGLSNVFSWSFRSISEKTLGAEYPGFTVDHPVVDRF